MLRWVAIGVVAFAGACGGDRAAAPRDAGVEREDAAEPQWDYLPRAYGGTSASDSGSPAAVDASRPPQGDAGWVRMEGLPDECPVERATHPERLFSLRWLPCTDGLDDGCERLEPPEGWEMAVDTPGWRGEEYGYFSMVIAESLQSRWRAVVIAPTEGAPIAAWRAPSWRAPAVPDTSCSISDVAIGEGFAAAEMIYVTREGDQFVKLYHAPLAEIGQVTEPIYTWAKGEPTLGSIQHMDTSATTVGAEVQPGGGVLIAEAGGSALVAFDEASGAPGVPQNVSVVGSTVLTESWGPRVRVVRMQRGEKPEVLVEAPTADVKSFATDGLDMAWAQGSPPGASIDYATLELWTAKYTESAADLQPRKVADLSTRAAGVVGGGLFAWSTTAGGSRRLFLEFYELDTGKRHEFVAPSGGSIGADPIYMTREEILVRGSVGDSELLRLKTAMILAQ